MIDQSFFIRIPRATGRPVQTATLELDKAGISNLHNKSPHNFFVY